MNTISRRHFLKAAAASSLALTVAGFAKNTFARATDTPLTINQLAHYYINPFSDKTIAHRYLNDYALMNFEEFEEFDKILIDSILNNKEIMYNSNRDNILIAQKFRSDINQQAYQTYSKSFNQLSAEEFNTISGLLWESTYKRQVDEVSVAAACICVIYPVITSPAGTTLYGHNSQGQQRAANSAGCGDCDLEVWFPFNQDRLQWVSGAGGIYYANQGGRLIMRKINPFNRILIGYGAVNTIFIGSEYLAQIAYRMIP